MKTYSEIERQLRKAGINGRDRSELAEMVCSAQIRPAVRAMFLKSGSIVMVCEMLDNKMWTVVKDDGKKMTVHEESLKKLGPYDCYCQSLAVKVVGDGCEICNG